MDDVDAKVPWSGWRGVALIAITYVYFLIFAQFAFLKRLAQLNIVDAHLKAVMAAMAAMALGGIAVSLLAPRLPRLPLPRSRMQLALGGCVIAAIATIFPLNSAFALLVAILIGGALGLLTVTLVTYLPLWIGDRNPLLRVGLGTGAGYFLCNFPPLFNASPRAEALTAAALCLAGLGIVGHRRDLRFTPIVPASRSAPLWIIVLSFTALIWFDSAAFFIIQNTPSLKSGTWQGNAHLLTNAALHLLAALASAWLLGRQRVTTVLGFAVLALASACLLLHSSAGATPASLLYPIGVSLYSVALVAYPSLFAPAASWSQRGRTAGLLYAVGGWFGSAMGIGMGQHLGYVPTAFVVVASAAVLGPWTFSLARTRRLELAVLASVLLLTFGIRRALQLDQISGDGMTQVERGRRVYIAEGCIHCHSQYVRPGTRDVVMWGPMQTAAQVRAQKPPLIGNRRQGPDLSEVGSRRSALWLKAHFIDPREVSHGSFMPSYEPLFEQPNPRGDDLVAYLQSLRTPGTEAAQTALRSSWQPSENPGAIADLDQGGTLFALYCSTCHAPNGATRERWRQDFQRLPPNLATGPWLHLDVARPSDQRVEDLAHIIRFGIPGTDMPGHEYFSDHDILSIAGWLNSFVIAQPIHPTQRPNPTVPLE